MTFFIEGPLLISYLQTQLRTTPKEKPLKNDNGTEDEGLKEEICGDCICQIKMTENVFEIV